MFARLASVYFWRIHLDLKKPKHPLEMVEIDLRLLASDQRLRFRDFANYTVEISWSL
jgi:hypothetical protein